MLEQQARAEEPETQAIKAVKRFGDAVALEPALKNSRISKLYASVS